MLLFNSFHYCLINFILARRFKVIVINCTQTNFLITNTVAATQLRELRREVRMSAEEARRRGEEYAMKTMGRTMKAIEMTDEDAAEYGQLFASVEGEVR